MRDRYGPEGEVETYEEQAVGRRPLSELKGKAIMSLNDGEKLGHVDDILIDREQMRVAGVVVAKGGILDRERMTVPASSIGTWGKDALLVQDSSALRTELGDPDRGNWVSPISKIKGMSIVSTSGSRLGQIDDILVDNDGRIVAYRVSEGRFGGHTREVPASGTKSIGVDAVIVDTDLFDTDVRDRTR